MTSTNQHQPAKFNIDDQYWLGLIDRVRTVMIPYQWKALRDELPDTEPSYCLQNFAVAAGLKDGKHHGFAFQDSDAYKWLEAVGNSLSTTPDAALERRADEMIDLICAAQTEDGYLCTYYIINGIDGRFRNLVSDHELYCAGHLLEAAMAYCAATGKRKLLDAALRFLACIRANVNDHGGYPGYPGHEELELALLRYYRYSGDEDALSYAEYLLDRRGQQPSYFLEECRREGRDMPWSNGPLGLRYYQAHAPVTEQTDACGHAVRAMYLYSAMADLCALKPSEPLRNALHALWESVTSRQMYVTGGIGSSPYGEAFTFDYDLPPATAYSETCASVGMIFWAQRMLMSECRSDYADVAERALYNVVLASMSEEMTSFFYVSPLEVVPEACAKDNAKRHVKPIRQPWFGCACCPPNVARLLTSLGSYVYTEQNGALYINQYIGGGFAADNGLVHIESGLPWDGRITITLCNTSRDVWVRIPSWSTRTLIRVNGVERAAEVCGEYTQVWRGVAANVTIELELDMSPKILQSCDKVRDTYDMLAVSRGPLIYCAESADNGAALHMLSLREDSDIRIARRENGRCDLEISGWRRIATHGALYQTAQPPLHEPAVIHMVPYSYWGNRGVGEMRVWLHRYSGR